MKKYAMDFIVNVLEEVKNNPTLSLAKIAENNNLTSGAPLIRWWIKRYNQFNKDIVEWRRNMADEKKDAFLATIENMNHQIEELKSEQNRMRQEHKKELNSLQNEFDDRLLRDKMTVGYLKEEFRIRTLENKMEVSSLKKEFRQKLVKEKMNGEIKVKQANKELKRLQHDYEGTLAKNEILKKSIPTCQATEMMEKTSRDYYQYLAHIEIFRLTTKCGWTVKDTCIATGVKSRDKFYSFLQRNNLPKPSDYKENVTYNVPKFKTRVRCDAEKYIVAFYNHHQGTTGSAREIHRWANERFALNEKSLGISERSFRKLMVAKPHLFPCYARKKVIHSRKRTIRDDLIGSDFVAKSQCEKIGMDGTWLKINVNGNQLKILLEVAYDWATRRIVSYTFGSSENVNVILETFRGVVNYARYHEKYPILQMDRGSANSSYELKYAEMEQPWVTISMSNVGFKHNPATESLNGWIKGSFFEANGYSFRSLPEFYKTFNNFVLSNNKKNENKYIREKNKTADKIKRHILQM
jgi:hypothetical protein